MKIGEPFGSPRQRTEGFGGAELPQAHIKVNWAVADWYEPGLRFACEI